MITKNLQILRAATSRIFPHKSQQTGGQFTAFRLRKLRGHGRPDRVNTDFPPNRAHLSSSIFQSFLLRSGCLCFQLFRFQHFRFQCFSISLFSLFLAIATLPVSAGECETLSPFVRPAITSYSASAPKIYAADGTYLGRLSSNPYLPDSISNPFGRYGSPYSSTSINNPYSRYGSPYSSMSPNNPFATRAPVLCFE